MIQQISCFFVLLLGFTLGCNQRTLDSYREITSEVSRSTAISIDGGAFVTVGDSVTLTEGRHDIVIEFDGTEPFGSVHVQLLTLFRGELEVSDSCIIGSNKVKYTTNKTLLEFGIKMPNHASNAFLRIGDRKRGIVSEIPITYLE